MLTRPRTPSESHRDERRLRSRQRLRDRGMRAGHAGKTVTAIEEIEDWRNDRCADDDAGEQRNLLAPGRRVDELTRFEILQIVV